MSKHLHVVVYAQLGSFLSYIVVTIVMPEHEGHRGRQNATYHGPKTVVFMHSLYVYLYLIEEAKHLALLYCYGLFKKK